MNFVAVTALVLGVATLASAQTPATPQVKPPAPQTPGVLPTKIAIISVQQAIMSTGDGRKAAAEMQAKFNPRQEALKKMQADIQAMQDQMKKGSATLSDDAKNKLARDIDAKTKNFQRDADELNADIEQENGRLMQDLGGKMQAVWEQYLPQNGYALLLDVGSQQTPVLWAAAAVDITPEIIKLYDQAHPVAAAAAAAPAAPKPAAPAPAVPPAKKK
ncbi:MAG: OmpH family outer membrane protein [Candidatus Sulfopaludibacter sp.]|nr:OmpH family outer membrane protein [Candidatus Sulfopaludibacter sp.]